MHRFREREAVDVYVVNNGNRIQGAVVLCSAPVGQSTADVDLIN